MTNYNKRLDEVLQNLSWKQHELGTKGLIPLSKHEYEAKQAIIDWHNKLVEEAKLGYKPISKYAASIYNQGFNQAVDEFEQNLLKALEEK